MADWILLNRIRPGLLAGLQDQAMLVTGTLFTVVSVVSGLSSAQETSFEKRVWEIKKSRMDRFSSHSEIKEHK